MNVVTFARSVNTHKYFPWPIVRFYFYNVQYADDCIHTSSKSHLYTHGERIQNYNYSCLHYKLPHQRNMFIKCTRRTTISHGISFRGKAIWNFPSLCCSSFNLLPILIENKVFYINIISNCNWRNGIFMFMQSK